MSMSTIDTMKCSTLTWIWHAQGQHKNVRYKGYVHKTNRMSSFRSFWRSRVCHLCNKRIQSPGIEIRMNQRIRTGFSGGSIPNSCDKMSIWLFAPVVLCKVGFLTILRTLRLWVAVGYICWPCVNGHDETYLASNELAYTAGVAK